MVNNFFKKALTILSLVLVLACKGKDENTLIVGSECNYPPFESYENNVLVGLDIDLIKELGKRIGKKVIIKDMAFDALLVALQTGKIDVAISGMSITEERKKSVNFTQGYFTSSSVVTVREDDNSIKSAKDLVGKKVATQIGTTEDAVIDKLAGVENVKLKNGPELIVHLTSKKVDAALLDSIVAKQIIENNKGAKVLYNLELDRTDLGIAVNKKNPQLLKDLNKALTDLKKEGFINSLYKKYNMGK